MTSPRHKTFALALLLINGFAARTAIAADPPVPAEAHPRLFMSTANRAAFTANATKAGTMAYRLVTACQDSMTKASEYVARGGADSSTWPATAVNCAFAHLATNDARYLTQALKFWKASLNDDQTIGDNLGCTVAAAAKDWRTNLANGYPPVLLTITHDTGYPMRFYGPYIALTYDWLYGSAGVDEALRAQTRSCLTSWLDYYTAQGYLNDFPGSNYNAGYVVGKTLGSIAIGTDGGADGHLWKETLHEIFETTLVGKGLANSSANLGSSTGILVGGDWGSWQYGDDSIMAYAVAARAVEEHGSPQPAMDAWTNSLITRYIHGTLPSGAVQFNGNGDVDYDSKVYGEPTELQTDVVLLGPSSDQAAGWALSAKKKETSLTAKFAEVWGAIAEIRNVTAQDYKTQTPPPPPWYIARGTGTMYVRTGWTNTAFWGAFMSPPALTDHGHFASSNFVFSRGADNLIVDSSNYGEVGTLETNALGADSSLTTGDDALTQTDFGPGSLAWARGTADAVFAARADIAASYAYKGKNDIPYAHREWVFLPEGEIVTIDRVHTSAATRNAFVNFNLSSAGTLKYDATTKTATGTSGASQVTIHAVSLSGGTPAITKPTVGNCSCSYPCGQCINARYPVDRYTLKVPGPWAVAVHVIDGLTKGEAPATVGSLNDDIVDPAPKQNSGVIGTSVFRASKQTFVVASSAMHGTSSSPMKYVVPGGSASRHIVFDAPEATDGTSTVTASASGTQCLISIVAGSGSGFRGRPLMFQVAASSGGCTATDDTNVAPGTAPPGGGVTSTGGSTGSTPGTGGNGTVGSGGAIGSGGGSGTTTGSGGSGLDSNAGTGGAGAGTVDLHPGVTGGPTEVVGKLGCGCATGGSHGSSALLFLAFASILGIRPKRASAGAPTFRRDKV